MKLRNEKKEPRKEEKMEAKMPMKMMRAMERREPMHRVRKGSSRSR